MEILRNLMPIVNEHIAVQKKLADKFAEEWRKSLHLESAKKFENMGDMLQDAILEYAKLEKENIELKNKISELEIVISKNTPLNASRNIHQLLSLNPSELDDLPEEVLSELSEAARDKTDAQILQLIEDNNGVITLDQLLIRLYKKHGETFKRQLLTNRLYRMVQAGLLYGVSGKKGAYSINHIEEEILPEGEDK